MMTNNFVYILTFMTEMTGRRAS